MNFHLEHLGIAARDPESLKNWYETVLGARTVFDNRQEPPAYLLALGDLGPSFTPSGADWASLREPMIEIYPGSHGLAETAYNRLCGWRHLALRVTSIEEAQRELAAKGVQFPDPIKPAGGGGRVLFFRDPEGNLLHLVERPQFVGS